MRWRLIMQGEIARDRITFAFVISPKFLEAMAGLGYEFNAGDTVPATIGA
jgi:hypothetical protein